MQLSISIGPCNDGSGKSTAKLWEPSLQKIQHMLLQQYST